jgi:uncharacterized protein
MSVHVFGHWRAPRSLLEPRVTKPLAEQRDGVRMADIDEDEVTMALDAAHALLEQEGRKASEVTGVVVASRTASGLAPVVAQILTGDASKGREVTAPELEDVAAEGLTICILSDAVRPTTGRLATLIDTAAEAWIAGGARTSAPPPEAGRDLDAALWDRMAKREPTGAMQSSMGAFIPMATWEAASGSRLRRHVSVCPKGHASFPARSTCLTCQRPTQVQEASRHATVYTYTVISPGGGPTEFDFLQEVHGAYASLIVSLDGHEGVRAPGIATQTPLEELRIGLPVESVVRRIYGFDGAWRYGTKYRPRRHRGATLKA